jgi:transmembrane sensor
MNAASSTPESIRLAAAHWTVRRDRGLSSTESIDYELWLAADPRHAVAMNRSGAAWSLLDRIPEAAAAPVLAAGTRRRSFWRRSVVLGSLAAAAALAFVAVHFSRAPAPVSAPAVVASSSTSAAGPRQLTLSDGTFVQLNTGGEVVEQFTAAERRVLLARGEAHFAVTKNSARPFVVRAGTVDVRAVGTAFNVNLQSAAVDVLVTEGIVQLKSSSEVAAAHAPIVRDPIPLLVPGQRAVVALAPVSPATAVVVTTATADEIAHTLAWQAPLLRLGGQTLAELALAFERRSGRRVILADPSLASLRVGGRFRADDLEGFTHLLATTLDLEVERAADETLVLRKKNPKSR